MQQIPLTKVAAQTTSFSLDGAYWTISVYPAVDHMVADIELNGTTLISGVRCFAGTPLLPYAYLAPGYGNFIFDQDADWENFGTSGTCFLWYMTADEVVSFNALIEEGYANAAYNAAD